ncbi:hypothetical protein SAMN05216178_6634 [Pseudomonas saponiphila]|jgi:hypothetical protein|uniref:Uncharacterized protein n=1 Tax=Pseudomonas saponiphila TaxID=556534 RepID=A0A1H4ZFM2_9PSED|nr:hypothetical protein [Pseudomonas saponiphila]SED28949.1 hypothetical protein SAMN05216178_6634 [Pseudomonas saponiphila]
MDTTTERLARLETAQELLSFQIAWLSKQIQMAREADARAVDVLIEQKSQLIELEDRLTLADPALTEQVIERYGPLVRSRQAR